MSSKTTQTNQRESGALAAAFQRILGGTDLALAKPQQWISVEQDPLLSILSEFDVRGKGWRRLEMANVSDETAQIGDD